MGLEDKLKASVDDLKKKAESAASDASSAGEDLKDKAQAKAKEVGAEVENKVGDAVDTLKDKLPD